MERRRDFLGAFRRARRSPARCRSAAPRGRRAPRPARRRLDRDPAARRRRRAQRRRALCARQAYYAGAPDDRDRRGRASRRRRAGARRPFRPASGAGGLLPLWQREQLAFIHAAGSPDPNRSHFDAQRYIENGTPGSSTTADGWMNRLLRRCPARAARPTRSASARPCRASSRGPAPVANLPLGARRRPADCRSTGREVAGAFDQLYAATTRSARPIAKAAGARRADRRSGDASRAAPMPARRRRAALPHGRRGSPV